MPQSTVASQPALQWVSTLQRSPVARRQRRASSASAVLADARGRCATSSSADRRGRARRRPRARSPAGSGAQRGAHRVERPAQVHRGRARREQRRARALAAPRRRRRRAARAPRRRPRSRRSAARRAPHVRIARSRVRERRAVAHDRSACGSRVWSMISTVRSRRPRRQMRAVASDGRARSPRRRMLHRPIALERAERVHAQAAPRQPRRAAEVRQVDDEAQPTTSPPACSISSTPRARCRRWRSGRRPAARARPADRVGVDLDAVGAVLELVVVADRGVRAACPSCAPATKPARARYATAPPRMKPRASMPATLSMPLALERARRALRPRREARRVLEQRRDVAEQDPGLRVVGDGADARLDRHRST